MLSLFKNETLLYSEYVPPKLIHRENELRSLERLFSHLEEGVSIRAAIVGPPGVGKTAVVKKVEKRLFPEIRVSYNYCGMRRSLYRIVSEIISTMGIKIKVKGKSPHELLELVNEIKYRERSPLIIVLDEPNMLPEKELVTLMKFPEQIEYKRAALGFVFVFRKIQWQFYKKHATLFNRIILMNRYTRGELYDILLYRRDLAIKEGVVSDDIVWRIAELSEGNARTGIQLLLHSTMYAERAGNDHVKWNDVLEIADQIMPGVSPEILDQFSESEIFVLISILDILRTSDTVSLKSAYDHYRDIALTEKTKPITYRAFHNVIDRLESAGILSTKLGNNREKIIYITSANPEVLLKRIKELRKKRKKQWFS